jgi:2-amino-4-hydroxy-6-hydroxymethyldihydropteridine diphosphokinase
MSQAQQCYIGLGSNLGDSQQILSHAVERLSQLGQLRVSRLYSSPPMGPQDQPDYLNAAVCLSTTLPPLALLDQLQHIENDMGRVRLRRWGERTLDLDLLLYAQLEMNHSRLTLPHAGLLLRDFVVLPLLDLDPELRVKQQHLKTLACVAQATAHAVADVWWQNA